MTPSVSAPDVPAAQTNRKVNPRILFGVVVIAAVGYWGWRQVFPPPASTVLTVSGRIEADETDIGAKTGGRIAQILVREGDPVKAGQLVAVIEDEEVDQQLQAAIAHVSAARQEEAQARLDISVAESRIQEAEANLVQSQADSQGRVQQAESTVAASQAQVAQAQAQVVQAEAEVKRAAAQLKLAQLDRDRFAALVAQGAINRQQFDQAQTNAETAEANLDTARATLAAQVAAVQTANRQFQAAQGSLTQTESTTLNPTIRSNQLAAYQQQKAQAEARLAAAQANVKAAIANQQQLQKRLDSFQVTSPITGVVQDRPMEPGAVVTSGKTLLTMINPQAIYLRAYIPQGDIGKIYVGKSARVFLDANPQQPLPAKVSAIDPKASFTPENIYFQKDRVRQVFGVKLAIEQDHAYAKPGMPADAEIDLK
ncbi:HlyD family secretion protein [Pantanalinema rosaneae CENA516]|uniref:HlyD family secretion protein n=1 Tax=Pantanalinema rosaneae TaxID=1620701 RepID=UPI003D6E6220